MGARGRAPPALPVGSPAARLPRAPTPRHRQRRLLRRRNDSGASSRSRGGSEAAGGGGGERGGEGGGGAAIAETPAPSAARGRTPRAARHSFTGAYHSPRAREGARAGAPGAPSASRAPHFGDTPPGGRGRRAAAASGPRWRPWRGVGGACSKAGPRSPPGSGGAAPALASRRPAPGRGWEGGGCSGERGARERGRGGEQRGRSSRGGGSWRDLGAGALLSLKCG